MAEGNGSESSSFFKPLNIGLSVFCVALAYVLYKLVFQSKNTEESLPEPLPHRDYKLDEIRKYDGVQNKRILIVVKNHIFDVTSGSNFYGKDGPYGSFAGKDASRALAKMSLSDEDVCTDHLADLNDLSTSELESLNEWFAQFKEKYELIGKVKTSDYSDSESNTSEMDKKIR